MIGITAVLNNPATRDTSHSAGWNETVAKLVSCYLNDEYVFLTEKSDFSTVDKLLICHGPNFKPGQFNLMGGVTEALNLRMLKIAKFTGPIYSVDDFDFDLFGKKRSGLVACHPTLNMLNFNVDLDRPGLVVGDSHCISAWPGIDYTIHRHDGMTLFGFLKQQKDLSPWTQVILYFGNIDIRFHLCSQPDPVAATVELIARYLEYASTQKATVVNLLPVETEARKLPGTGLYKGQRFFGSREKRQELVDVANAMINSSGLKTIKWPDWFKNDRGELRIDVMEAKQSVHLAPKYYQRNLHLHHKSNELPLT